MIVHQCISPPEKSSMNSLLSTMAAHSAYLSLGRFKMNIIEANAKNSILNHIEQLEGSKVIIWDQELMGPVTLLRVTRQLQELNVEEMHSLVADNIPYIKAQHVVFIVRPNLSQMDLVADYVHAITRDTRGRTARREFSILFIPRVSQLCERRLQTRGVLGSMELRSSNIYLFPFDSDLMSMEMENAFWEYAVEKDPSKLMDAAIALKELDTEFGPFPHIIGRGPASKIVADHYLQLRRISQRRGNVVPSVHHVILLDRQVDMITPLATQLTYEGLIDEFFNLKNTTASFPPERFSKEEEEGVLLTVPTKKIVYFNSGDELYAELRDRNFNGIGPALRKKAKTVAQQIEKRHNDKTMENMKKFVSQLPQLQAAKRSLALHTTIAELIKEKTDESDFLENLEAQQQLLCGVDADKCFLSIEDAVCKKAPLIQVLRLICLQSLVSNGLKPKVLDFYKRELITTYGINLLIPLANLGKAGLLKPSSAPKNYAALKRMLRLIVEDDSEVEPTDISYTHSIYAPLSVRLIQNFKLWNSNNFKDIIDLVEGPTIEHTLGRIPNNSKADDRQLVLVFFIGGCTYSEISALRFLSQKEDSDVEFIVATTKIVNGTSFLKSIMTAQNFPDLCS